MNKKQAKKIRKFATAKMEGRSVKETDKFYKNLKLLYKLAKGQK